jgi:photosystem II stability/assembly factor-like uncharacterized protein
MRKAPRLALLAVLLPASAALAGDFWTQTAGPEGGPVSTLAFGVDGWLFAGTTGGGVFRSPDGGSTWAQASRGLAMRDVECLAVDSGPGLLLAGTTGGGVFRSKDDAATWDARVLGLPPIVHCLGFDAHGAAYAGTEDGLFKTTDGGARWDELGLAGECVAACVALAGGGLLAGTHDSGVYRSTDGGTLWAPVTLRVGRVITSLAVNPGGEIFAATDEAGVLRSSDGGLTWSRFVVGLDQAHLASLAISPNGHLFVGAAGGGVFRSVDDGVSWLRVGLNAVAVSALGVDRKGLVFAGTSAGVYTSEDEGDVWVPRDVGLANAVVTSLVAFKGMLFGGTDGAGVFRSRDLGAQWQRVGAGMTNLHIESLSMDVDGVLLAGAHGSIFRSTDEGNSWTLAYDRLHSGWASVFALGTPGQVFAGTWGNGFLASPDGGVTWSVVPSAPALGYFHALASDAVGRLYSWAEDQRTLHGAFRSEDGGTHWTSIGLTSTVGKSLAVGPQGQVLAGTYEGVYRSDDAGAHWTQILATGSVVSSLAFGRGGIVYAGTGLDRYHTREGIYRSTDGGVHWAAIDSGLTNPLVRSIVVQPSGYVFAGTWGGGVFRSLEPDATPVELYDFAAAQEGADVIVRWRAARESQVVSYRVYRARAGEPFEVLAPDVTTRADLRYTYCDAEPAPGHYTYRIAEVSPEGGVVFHRSVEVDVTRVAPRASFLDPSVPNPFNPGTTLRYGVAAAGPVRLAIFDVRGRRVRTLVDAPRGASGSYRATWDGRDERGRPAAAGVYEARLETATGALSRRLTLVK